MNMILIAKLPNLEATPWINEVISINDYRNHLDETCKIFGLSEIETYPCDEPVSLDLKALNKKAKAMAKELKIPAKAIIKTDGSTDTK